MINDIILEERARIREIIVRKIDSVIKRRAKMKKGFEELQDNILFLVDNPDYVRVEKSESYLKAESQFQP